MSEYHAAVGLAELEGWTEKRAALRSIAESYRARLTTAGLPDRFIGAPDVAGCYALFHSTDAAEAARAQESLDRSNVEYRLWYGKGLLSQAYFSQSRARSAGGHERHGAAHPRPAGRAGPASRGDRRGRLGALRWRCPTLTVPKSRSLLPRARHLRSTHKWPCSTWRSASSGGVVGGHACTSTSVASVMKLLLRGGSLALKRSSFTGPPMRTSLETAIGLSLTTFSGTRQRMPIVLLAMDADTLPVADLEDVLDAVFEAGSVAGVIAHYPTVLNSPGDSMRETWTRLADGLTQAQLNFGYAHTLMATDAADDHRLTPFYLNFGVVFFPRPAFQRIADRYLAIRPRLMSRMRDPTFPARSR